MSWIIRKAYVMAQTIKTQYVDMVTTGLGFQDWERKISH